MRVPIYSLRKRGISQVVILSDLHIGAEHHCAERLAEAIEWATEENAFVILNGDLLENAIVEGKAPGDKLLDQAIWPTEQWKRALAMFSPFAERGKLLFGTRGNHDARTRRTGLIDLCDLLITAMPKDVDYLDVGGLVRLQCGDQVYTIAVQHGSQHSQDPYRENRRLAEVYPQAELIALGHNHHLGCEVDYHITTSESGEEEVGQRYLLRTGTFLGYPDYARERSYRPRAMGCPIIRLSSSEHRIEVDCQTLRWP